MMRTLIALCALVGVSHADDAEMGRHVQELLRAHQADVFGCVGKQPRTDIEGEALIRLVGGRDSIAERVEVLKSEAPVRAVAECVASSARGWDVSVLKVGEGEQVVFPLAFHREAPNRAAVGARISHRAIAAKRPDAVKLTGPSAIYAEGALSIGAQRLAAGDVAYLPSGGEVSIFATRATGIVLIESTAAATTSAVMTLHRAKDVTPIKRSNGTVRLYLDGVAAPFAVDRLCFDKGATVPAHQHDGSDELLYVLSGAATTSVDGRDVENRAGDTMTIPRGTQHAVRVTSAECVVQVYAPAGPEQRFKP